jgi:hypothetical protein
LRKGLEIVRKPLPSEEYIIITDNKGRTRIESVEYVVLDVYGENVYVTVEGLNYTEDSLYFKEQDFLIAYLDQLANICKHPDIVIWDPLEPPNDTLIYYKQLYIAPLRQHKLVAVIVKTRDEYKFFYNLHLQESGKVKGLTVVLQTDIEVWYIAPQVKPHQFGL